MVKEDELMITHRGKTVADLASLFDGGITRDPQ